MVVEKPEIFYKEFPYKYWLYKAEMLFKMIEDDEKVYHDKDGNLEALGGNKKEFDLMLKYELHFTYYHQAEALFELIFALENVISESKYVWLEMSKYKPGDMQRFAKKVNRLSEGSDELKAKKVSLTDGSEVSFYEWLFYDTFKNKLDLSENEIENTKERIDQIIRFAALDLSDKGEYNAFKHGMRALHILKDFSINGNKDSSFNINFNLNNSFTYINFPKNEEESGTKKGDIQEITKGYNPKLDMFKIQLLTITMAGIIEIRKQRFYNKGKVIHFNDKDICKKINELTPNLDYLIYTKRNSE